MKVRGLIKALADYSPDTEVVVTVVTYDGQHPNEVDHTINFVSEPSDNFDTVALVVEVEDSD